MGFVMHRSLYPILLLAVVLPAQAHYCDGDPQLAPGEGGQNCTLTRVAYYDPTAGRIVSDYSELKLPRRTAGPLYMDVDLSGLVSSVYRQATLLEFGFVRAPSEVDGDRVGGTLALQVVTGPYTQPQLGWMWYEGSDQISVLDPSVAPTDKKGVTEWVSVSGSLHLEIAPAPDWCHPSVLVTDDNYTYIATNFEEYSGNRCDASILRAGVMGDDLEDGDTVEFEINTPWLIELANASP
jgi:hypothetical protein